ncbi:MAG: TetR/AcrR family transcriptional regulator [Treponema sp.]|nr:TetR/AcrR family transcriptional regulator [Treponema sp.]
MTRADIIRVAFDVWGRTCYRSTSLSEVAGELQVSKAALYRHFTSKQALLQAMYDWFLDDYSAAVKDGFHQATATGPREAIGILIRVIMGYYARNAHVFMFSLVYVYGEQRLGNSRELLIKRGVNMEVFEAIQELIPGSPATQLVLATLIFAMAYFHRVRSPETTAPPEGGTCAEPEIEWDISLVLCIVSHGVGFHKKETDTLDYGFLEGKVSGINRDIEENELLHSVAEAVAGAGPWNVSMEMVAQVSGLSKSGLYAHFTNKRDMVVQLFVTEFDRIIDFAEKSMEFSADPAERLYLAIFTICDYLRSRPDVLIALDWLRTRRIGARESGEKMIPPRFYRIFRNILCSAELKRRLSGIEDDWIPAWILFLIVASLMHGIWADSRRFMEWLNMPKGSRRKLSREELAKVPNESFRNLYRFIVLGIGDSGPPAGTDEASGENYEEDMVRQ